MPELQDVHRRWRHLRSGGEIQTVLVSLTGFIAPQEVRQHRTGPIKDGFIAVYSFTYLVLRVFFLISPHCEKRICSNFISSEYLKPERTNSSLANLHFW